MKRSLQKYKMSYPRQIKSIIPQMSQIFGISGSVLSPELSRTEGCELCQLVMICLCHWWGGFFGHGSWQLTTVAVKQLLTSQSPVRSDLWWVCFQKSMYVHSCSSPWHECVLTDAVACLCVFGGDGRNLAKWTLQMPLIARWIRREIPLGRGQRINS